MRQLQLMAKVLPVSCARRLLSYDRLWSGMNIIAMLELLRSGQWGVQLLQSCTLELKMHIIQGKPHTECKTGLLP